MMKNRENGFTLIELLIVVAIIAILAAIAVPNFLEAQMRAKIGRVKADQRTLAMALESYAVDCNGKYPPHVYPGGSFGWANAQRRLTSPIAYMTSLVPDQFQLKVEQMMVTPGDVLPTGDYWIGGNPRADKTYNPLARGDKLVMDYDFNYKGKTSTASTIWELSYGRSFWKVQSFGPMRDVNKWGQAETITSPGFPNKYYDSTNGTISGGLITRTQQFSK